MCSLRWSGFEQFEDHTSCDRALAFSGKRSEGCLGVEDSLLEALNVTVPLGFALEAPAFKLSFRDRSQLKLRL